MEVFASSTKYKVSFEQTFGDANVLRAENGGTIEHDGRADKVYATKLGRVSLTGEAVSLIESTACGEVWSHGDTEEVVADEGGRVMLNGNPEFVVGSFLCGIYIFGNPKKIKLLDYGQATVISKEPDYEPDELELGNLASVRLITPGDNEFKSPLNFLENKLDQLFESRQDGELYLTYRALLERNNERYL